MITFLTTLTLLLIALCAYVYAGYPVLLWLLNAIGLGKPHKREALEPSVTLIISAYNEADVIEDKLQNTFELDYPADKLDILVISDGSDDGTDELVKRYENQGVRLIRQEGRLGKTMGLNLGLDATESDIVVFSDANAMYAPDAVRQLCMNFADEKVGYAVGAALYTDGKENAAAANEGLYWKYELAVKNWESRLHSVVGGDGAIYAIRRKLWQPLQQRDINDFVNPLQIIAQGYRGVFDANAKCFEETAGDFNREASRKERIVNRSIRGLFRVKEVMNPVKSGWFSVQVISHKLMRWLLPVFAAFAILTSALLSALGLPLFQLITAGSALLFALAFIGSVWQNGPMPVSFPYYFVLVNFYAVKGVWRAMKGETQVTWKSARPGQKAGTRALPITTITLAIATALLSVAVIWV